MSYPVSDMENTEAVSVSTSQFDIKKFIFKLIGILPWIILSIIVCYSSAIIYLRYTPKLHKVSANVLIKDDAEKSPDYNVLRELGVDPGSKEVRIALKFLKRAVDRGRLDADR